MSREVHVRFREGAGGRLPCATRRLLGFSGPREEAEAIKAQLNEYLRETLKLRLSDEKTLITNARTQSARFLGYDVVNQHADDKRCRTQHRRCINGAPGLRIPDEVIRAKCAQYIRRGKVCHLAARMHDADYSIVTQYQAEYRGFVQYYVLAYNVHRLWRVHRVMQLSLVFTLADKSTRRRRKGLAAPSRCWKPATHGAAGRNHWWHGLAASSCDGRSRPSSTMRRSKCTAIAVRWSNAFSLRHANCVEQRRTAKCTTSASSLT